MSAGAAGVGPADERPAADLHGQQTQQQRQNQQQRNQHERPGTITTIHRYDLPLSRPEVWALICDVRNYRDWWPWLRVFEAQALALGEEWRCQVQPPVPYPVRFRVVIEQVQAPSLVSAQVHGDVVGEATLTLDEAGAAGDRARGAAGATRITLSSALAPGNAALRLVSRLAPPVARFGHDWVLDSGVRQFVARAGMTDGGAGGARDDGTGPETDVGPPVA